MASFLVLLLVLEPFNEETSKINHTENAANI